MQDTRSFIDCRYSMFYRIGIVMDDCGRCIKVNHNIRGSFKEAIEQPDGGLVPDIEEMLAGCNGLFN